MSETDRFQDLVGAIADSRPVDWQSATEHAASEELDTLAELRIIAEIARLHREHHSADLPGRSASPQAHGEPPAEPALFVWGPLHVVERLGAGAFGEVFRAWDTSLDRQVALKLLRVLPATGPRAAESIVREGQLLARVRHPNVLAVYGAQEIEGVVGIWGEFLDGRTLAEIVTTEGPLSAEEASIFLEPVCRALTAVHRAGLLHRDIKAQNVMREAGGRIVLMDFGLGREVDLPDGMHGLELAGTPPYLAPELFNGVPASAQSDIYSVGVLAFYLVTGRFPVEGASLADVSARHTSGKRTRLEDLRSDLPAAFVHVIERALDAERSSRFESAGALQNALVRARQSFQVAGAPTPVHPWWRIAVPSALLSAMVCAAVALLLLRPRADTPPGLLTYSLSAPEGIAFTEGARNVPVISPDGQHVAFIGTELGATTRTRISRLYVWPLSEARPRPIPGSEAATMPFWSADSQSLAFVSTVGGEPALYRVSLSGARSERLASLWESRGGTWNADGAFVVARMTSGLYRLLPGGRDVEPLTSLDRSRQETAHMWPLFLPGGRRFIFYVQSPDQRHRGIYLGALDGTAPRKLVFSDSSAVYGDGHLLYVSGGTLFAQRFDPAEGTLSGSPQAIVPRVDATPDGRTIVSVSENGRLVYAVDKDLRQLRWYDLAGRTSQDVAVGKFRNPALSPHDPSLLAVEWTGDPPSGGDVQPQPARHELRIFQLPGPRLSPVRLIGGTCPVWGPDGQLAFAEVQPGRRLDLFVVRAEAGPTRRLLTRTSENKETTDWSRDGRTIVYQELDANGRRKLWFQSASGGAPTLAFEQQGEFSWMNGRLSPNGRWLAYSSTESLRRDDPDVFIRELSTGTTVQVSESGGYNPVWRSDQSLLYLDPLGWLREAAVPDGTRKAASSRPLFATEVITPRTSLRHFDLSADGRVLIARPLPSTISVIINWTSRLTPAPE